MSKNPADKLHMPQKQLQLKTVTASICNSQPGKDDDFKIQTTKPKNSTGLFFGFKLLRK